MKSCINCKKEISNSSVFCSYCGAKQPVDEAVESTRVETEGAKISAESGVSVDSVKMTPKIKKGAGIAAIIRNSIIMAVAVLLLVGSFLPIISLDNEEIPMRGSMDADVDVTFSLNAFQYITLFFDSFKDTDDIDDLNDVYSELVDEFRDFDDDDFENLTLKEKSKINQIFFISLRAVTQLDDGGPSVSLVASTIFGILNIILCVALFVVALLNLLATFNIVNRGKAQLYKWTVALITASPAIILAAYYAGSIYTGGRMSAMAIWSLICVVTVVIISMIFRYIFSNRDTVRNIVSRAIALVLSVVVFCLAFAPIFLVTFKTEVSGSYSDNEKNVTVSHKVSFFEGLAISNDEGEDFDSLIAMSKSEKEAYFAKRMEIFTRMTKKQIEGDMGESANSDILVQLLGAKLDIPLLNAMSLIVIFFIVTVIFALLILWQSLYFFITGKHVKLLVTISKIYTAVFAALALIMTITSVVVANYYANIYIRPSYDVSISVGIIIMFIFALGSIFCPGSLVPKAKKAKRISDRYTAVNFEPQF